MSALLSEVDLLMKGISGEKRKNFVHVILRRIFRSGQEACGEAILLCSTRNDCRFSHSFAQARVDHLAAFAAQLV